MFLVITILLYIAANGETNAGRQIALLLIALGFLVAALITFPFASLLP